MEFKVRMLAFAEANDVPIRVVKVPDAELNGVVEHDLERIFYWGQNDFQPQNMCSVSVGDVVEFNNELWMVVTVGFRKLTAEEYVDYFNTEHRTLHALTLKE
jgi:hypothetical protein